MGKSKALNQRRLTKAQVKALIAEGATLRPDLMQCFETTYRSGEVDRPPVYELEGDRFLLVFDKMVPGLAGKGDIYPGAYFRRFARQYHRSQHDELLHLSAVGHWRHFSKLKGELPSSVDRLLAELAQAMDVSGATLDRTYPSLDAVSKYIGTIGSDAAAEQIYDHLVGYVGEVMRSRTKGTWQIDATNPTEPYPYVMAEQHAQIMPINVVWSQFFELDSVDLRRAAANELRSARARFYSGPPLVP